MKGVLMGLLARTCRARDNNDYRELEQLAADPTSFFLVTAKYQYKITHTELNRFTALVRNEPENHAN